MQAVVHHYSVTLFITTVVIHRTFVEEQSTPYKPHSQLLLPRDILYPSPYFVSSLFIHDPSVTHLS
jgi:hypothetical protein